MSLPEQAIQRRLLTYFCTILLFLGGVGSYFLLGQLEDPDFTIKQVVVMIPYPGASPEEVEREVTEKVERKLQELGQIDYLKSMSRAGMALIDVKILPEYTANKIPQVKDEVRRKIYDIEKELPKGSGPPVINDDFGQVFGFVLALAGQDYSYAELEVAAKEIQRELSLVPGASRVDLWGVQEKAIYIDISQSHLVAMGLSPATVINTLQNQNMIVDAGGVETDKRRFRIQTTGVFQTADDIRDLTFRPSPIDRFTVQTENSDDLIRLGDIAEVNLGYSNPPVNLMRFNGKRALGISIAVVAGGNVVHLGEKLDQAIDKINTQLPAGMMLEKVAWQSDLVTESIASFLISLAEAVLIVLIVLWLAMGKENAFIVGTALVLTVLATFIVMAIWGIDLQRMSLGALVIALGMMVDNAIVVADGASVRIQKGMDAVKASIQAAASPAWPLFGATLIAVSFFFPIYLSNEDAGEFCESLFLVVAISLLLSWVISMTITPLQCSRWLKKEEGSEEGKEGFLLKTYRSFLRFSVDHKWITIGFSVALLASLPFAFPYVPKMFFPNSSRLQFMVDYWGPEGTRIQETAKHVSFLEEFAIEHEGVTGIASFIGQGPPRFYLPVEPEKVYPSFAHLLINVESLTVRDKILSQLSEWGKQNVAEAEVRGREFSVGPGRAFKFEARFLGTADADLTELREVGEKAAEIVRQSRFAKDVRVDWRQRTPRLELQYNQHRGRWTGATRADVGRAAKRSYDGLVVGHYRDQEDLIPIKVRQTNMKGREVNLDAIQVVPEMETEAVPMAQIADTIYSWEDPIIWRRDRKRTITVQAEPDGGTLSQLMGDVAKKLEEMELPPGYTMEWGGEREDSAKAQNSLLPGLIPVALLVPVILVALFNRKRTPMIVMAVIPFGLIGVVYGLLITREPFGFMALLGAMSLAGMMIKNAIVLIDEIRDQELVEKDRYRALEEACVSRLRPVSMAAATTILGVVPLLQDVFWVSMAVVIMAGLLVGTVITMIFLPALYAAAYRIKKTTQGKERRSS